VSETATYLESPTPYLSIHHQLLWGFGGK